MTALAFLVITREIIKKGSTSGADHSLFPLSVNEIRRSWNRIVRRVTHTVDHVLHWSIWRRTSHARARISHYRKRHHNLSLSS